MTASALWLPLLLLALNVYALVLVLARGPVFGTKVYRPMILNIGLSMAPVLVLALMGGLMLAVVAWAGNTTVPTWLPSLTIWAILILGGLAWFFLLPNAAYLITELNLSHRKAGENVPLWYDIVLVLTLALSGILNTLSNVALAQLTVALLFAPEGYEEFNTVAPWLAVALALLLVSLGIYIGRYVRLNSWDLLHPSSLIRKLGTHFRTRGTVKTAVGFVLIHSVLLLILYAIVFTPGLERMLTATTH